MEVPERTILVEEGICDRHEPGQFNFTLAHEAVGHLACHSDVNLSSGMLNREHNAGTIIMCRPEGERYPKYGQKTSVDWMEWQADYCGAAVLMPRNTVQMAIDMILWNAGTFGGSYGMREVCRSSKLFGQVAM
jgi:Zn-dependent peptidase ImmA (M78 family)